MTELRKLKVVVEREPGDQSDDGYGVLTCQCACACPYPHSFVPCAGLAEDAEWQFGEADDDEESEVWRASVEVQSLAWNGSECIKCRSCIVTCCMHRTSRRARREIAAEKEVGPRVCGKKGWETVRSLTQTHKSRFGTC
jgi:hypothetical protein